MSNKCNRIMLRFQHIFQMLCLVDGNMLFLKAIIEISHLVLGTHLEFDKMTFFKKSVIDNKVHYDFRQCQKHLF